LAAGTRDAVQHVIEMAQAAADATFVNRPDLLELRGFFDSGDPVVVVLAWPPDVRNASNAIIAASAGLLRFAGWGPVSSIVDKLGIGRALAARLARESTGVRANFAGVMQDQETATAVFGGLTMIKGLSDLVPIVARGQGGNNGRSGMSLDRRGATVSVGMLIPDRDWKP
jgi:hypothetical protein